MQEIGLFEAKTNLSKIAERVRRTGQPVTLTKHGQPYVDLIPHKQSGSLTKSKAKVLAELEKLRKQLPPSSYAQIKADRDEGRP